DRPAWYLGEGWSVTPETAGIAGEDGRGLSKSPITGWIWREPGPVSLMVGGRNLSLDGPTAKVRVAIDGRAVDDITVLPGFFLRMLSLPAGSLSGPGDYAAITIAAAADSGDPAPTAGRPTVAIEQFDARPAGQVVFGYDEG